MKYWTVCDEIIFIFILLAIINTLFSNSQTVFISNSLEAVPGNIRQAEHFVAFMRRFVEYLKVSTPFVKK